LAQVANIHEQMNGGKRVVTDEIATKLMGAKIRDADGNEQTVYDMIGGAREKYGALWDQSRRELITREQQEAARTGQGTAQPGQNTQPPVGGGLPPPIP
jgi:hypothetical protein